MKKLIVAFMAFLVAGQVLATDRYIIRDDGGGRADEFKKAVEYLKRENIKLKVDGYCASACTLVLDKTAKLDVCVTPKATFLIHSPYAMAETLQGPQPVFFLLTAVAADQMLKEQFLSVYPDWLVEYLKDKRIPSVAMGDSPADMVEVGFDVLSKHVPICDLQKKLVETRF